MPFNDTLLSALQGKINQEIKLKSPRLAALLLDNNCAVLKTKFNNVDTQENLNSAFAEQLNNPLTQNLNDANLKTYLQGLGFEDKVNSQDNRAVILMQMQAATIPGAMTTLVQQATEYVANLETQKKSLDGALAKNEKDADNPNRDEAAAIEIAKKESRAKITALDESLTAARKFKTEIERQNGELVKNLEAIKDPTITAANAAAMLQNQLPNVINLRGQLTQLNQTSERIISLANAEIVKVSKRRVEDLDLYLQNIIKADEILDFIDKNDQEMKIAFEQLSSVPFFSKALEILLLGIKDPDQASKTEPHTLRGLLAKHLWAKENNSIFAQAQREKDQKAVKERIEACKKHIDRYEQQLAHLNNTTEQEKVAQEKAEIAKRKKILEDYVASAEIYYSWLVKIIKDNHNQVKATKALSYTALSKPLPAQHLQGETGQLVQVLKINDYVQKITAGIGGTDKPLILPTQLQENQMMVVKAQFADSVFAISTTGVHLLQNSKSNSMFNVFNILDKPQEQLEWDTLQAMYAYVRDCQGEIPIPIYGNDERTVEALYAAALAMGKEVKVLYGYTIPAQGSKEDQQLQQMVESMKIKLEQLGALEANQLETDPAVVKNQLAAPPAA